MASPTWADQGSVLPDPTGAVRRQRSHDSPPGAKIATIEPTGGLYDQDKTAYALPPRTMATSVTMVPSVFDGRKARAGPTLAVPLTKAAAHPAPPRNTAPPPFFAHGREKLLSVHLGDQTTVFSTQVLQEYFVAATRIGLPAELAQRHVATDAQANIVQVTTELILAAIDLHRLHRLSFRDALIVPFVQPAQVDATSCSARTGRTARPTKASGSRALSSAERG